MTSHSNVSRRRFMRTAAAAATAPVVAASVSASASTSQADVLAAATIVRATLSRNTPGTLRLGVRVSVMAEGYRNENLVVSVDDVQFNATADTTREKVTAVVRDRVAHELARNNTAISPERVAVQVFGGVL